MLKTYSEELPLNIGSGPRSGDHRLARTISSIVRFTGELRADLTMPDGTPSKLLDSSRLMALDWSPETGLHEGRQETFCWFCSHVVMDVTAQSSDVGVAV